MNTKLNNDRAYEQGRIDSIALNTHEGDFVFDAYRTSVIGKAFVPGVEAAICHCAGFLGKPFPIDDPRVSGSIKHAPLIDRANYNPKTYQYEKGEIVCWYDRTSRNWIAYLVDEKGNQCSEAMLFGHRDDVNDADLQPSDFDRYC